MQAENKIHWVTERCSGGSDWPQVSFENKLGVEKWIGSWNLPNPDNLITALIHLIHLKLFPVVQNAPFFNNYFSRIQESHIIHTPPIQILHSINRHFRSCCASKEMSGSQDNSQPGSIGSDNSLMSFSCSKGSIDIFYYLFNRTFM